MAFAPLQTFIRASDTLTEFGAQIGAIKGDDLDISILEERKSKLEKLWQSVHKSLRNLENSENVTKEHLHLAENKHNASLNIYSSTMATINRKIIKTRCVLKNLIKNADKNQELSAQSFLVPESQENMAANISSGCDIVHNMTLPPIDINVFEGDFSSWPSFRELFSAVYINNSRLSDVERMFYLLNKTSGEAREIVSQFPLTNRGFAFAWKALNDEYNNIRLLVHQQLKSLNNLPILEKETAVGLKEIRLGINSCIFSMSIYNVPTDQWDPILVFLCLQRLPEETTMLWEQGIKNKSALSSWKDLDTFLSERINTLVCLESYREKSIPSTDTNSFNTATKSNSKCSYSPSIGKTCSLCSEKIHRLHLCSKFKNLSPANRFAFVKRNDHCINCLVKGHKLVNCTSKNSCLKCGQRHHMLLHRESVKPNSSIPVLTPKAQASSSKSLLSAAAPAFRPSKCTFSTSVEVQNKKSEMVRLKSLHQMSKENLIKFIKTNLFNGNNKKKFKFENNVVKRPSRKIGLTTAGGLYTGIGTGSQLEPASNIVSRNT
ncbi:uncharacterized protein LOC131803918 [Musca domestica]|uniref:Uncharacterized protein LOC131803918 n=1 Tax=Musca domestica TaxID=7370 RepID=A0ABM3V7S7_MUSDO|nr:uncharacterized protein LOC131803918 [Musca domestica]